MQTVIRSQSLIAVTFSGILFLFALMTNATEPVGWRNDGSGCFANCQPPTSWSTENHLRWKKDLSGSSMSSPVVVADCVFTMVEPTELICLRVDDGSIVWRRSHNYSDIFPPEKVREIETQHAEAAKIRQRLEQLQKQLTEVTKGDPASTEKQALEADIASLQKQYEEATPYPPATTDGTGNATGTPVSDGRAVWSVFATGIVSSHKLDGNRNWMQFLEKPTSRHTASPIVTGNRLIVHFKNLMALDADDGHVLWRAETPARNGTPVVTRVANSELIVTPAGSVIGVADGQILAEKLFDLAYCSPIVQDGVVYAIERGATNAVQLSAGDGQSLTTKVLWETRGAEDDRLASPVVHQGLLYSISGKGILEVVEADSGERVYRKRLDLGQGRADPSLVIAGDLLFVSSNSGRTLVVKPGREYEEISRNELEGFSSSPFFHAECTYIRTPKHLYCIGQ